MKQELVQDTSEWLQWRRSHIGSSDAPVIMGASPYMTRRELWQEKRGVKAFDRSSWATERGKYFEPKARALYETLHDREMPAAVFVHPEKTWMGASLDGWNGEDVIVLEIKVPGGEVFNLAKDGKVHEQYIWQLEHQLYVTGAKEVHFFCVKVRGKKIYKGKIEDHAMAIYVSDPERREKLIEKEWEFWTMVQEGIEPELEARDTLERDDENSQKLFLAVRDSMMKMEALDAYRQSLEKEQRAIKLLLIQNMKHTCESSCGVLIKKTKLRRKDELDQYVVSIT